MSDSTMGGGGALPSPPLELPSSMPGFRQTGACVETSRTLNLGTRRVPRARSFPVLEIPGETLCPAPAACPVCGGRTRPNGAASCRLAHLPFGGSWSVVTVYRPRARCTRCGASARAPAPQRVPGRTATLALVRLVEDLLAYGLTPTDVALATGLCRQVVREVDRERLACLHTRPTPDGGRELSPPAARSRLLGVDEFKLHDGHRYATVVLDLESGHVLWLARGKRRSALEGFFDLAGDEWMGGVEAVACDMNSDCERAFRERYPPRRGRVRPLPPGREPQRERDRRGTQGPPARTGESRRPGGLQTAQAHEIPAHGLAPHTRTMGAPGDRATRPLRETGLALLRRGRTLMAGRPGIRRPPPRARRLERAPVRRGPRQGHPLPGLREPRPPTDARTDRTRGRHLPWNRRQALRLVRPPARIPHGRHLRARPPSRHQRQGRGSQQHDQDPQTQTPRTTRRRIPLPQDHGRQQEKTTMAALHTPQRTKIRQEPQLLSSTSSKAPITLSGICDWKKSRSLRCSRSSVRSPGIAATP